MLGVETHIEVISFENGSAILHGFKLGPFVTMSPEKLRHLEENSCPFRRSFFRPCRRRLPGCFGRSVDFQRRAFWSKAYNLAVCRVDDFHRFLCRRLTELPIDQHSVL